MKRSLNASKHYHAAAFILQMNLLQVLISLDGSDITPAAIGLLFLSVGIPKMFGIFLLGKRGIPKLYERFLPYLLGKSDILDQWMGLLLNGDT